MTSGVYIIKNKINNKVYIGSSIHIPKRWKEHIRHLDSNEHTNQYLQNSWNQNGKDNFEFLIAEECDIENLLIVEQKWLDTTKSYEPENGYNICQYAGNTLGRFHTEEARKKISENHHDVSGENNPMFGVPSPNFGKRHSEETKNKISQKLKGKKSWNEGKTKENDLLLKKHSQRMTGKNNPFYGKTLSEERKDQLRKNKSGENNSLSKLTWEKVRQIRKLNKDGLSNRKIAAMFDVSSTTICSIVNNLSWKEENNGTN